MIKTASSVTTTELVQNRSWISWGKGHAPCYSMFDPEVKDLCQKRFEKHPADWETHFGGIRNPWDWYGSLWQHTIDRDHFIEWRKPYILKHDGFKGFLYGCTHIPEVTEITARPMVIVNPWPNTGWPDGSVGLWSWGVDYFYRKDTLWLIDHLVPVCHIQEGLQKIIGLDKELPLENTAQGRIILSPVKRMEGFTDYSSWYDNEMLGWVAEADKEFIQQFQFEPFAPCPVATYSFPEAPRNREHFKC